MTKTKREIYWRTVNHDVPPADVALVQQEWDGAYAEELEFQMKADETWKYWHENATEEGFRLWAERMLAVWLDFVPDVHGWTLNENGRWTFPTESFCEWLKGAGKYADEYAQRWITHVEQMYRLNWNLHERDELEAVDDSVDSLIALILEASVNHAKEECRKEQKKEQSNGQ